MITSQNRPGLPDFSRVTLKHMGRPGDEAIQVLHRPTCTYCCDDHLPIPLSLSVSVFRFHFRFRFRFRFHNIIPFTVAQNKLMIQVVPVVVLINLMLMVSVHESAMLNETPYAAV